MYQIINRIFFKNNTFYYKCGIRLSVLSEWYKYQLLFQYFRTNLSFNIVTKLLFLIDERLYYESRKYVK